MREIVLDTETTGLDPLQGHRLVEIGCVELVNHFPTGKTWHEYFNPGRDMPEEAFKVHGISSEFLADKPIFEELADAFLEFIGDSRLIIHNAPFDMKFLNFELKLVNRPLLSMDRVLDTLAVARRKFPGGQNNLDALCRRFKIDNSNRTLHGALLDSQLLAEVYIELIGGRQPDMLQQVAQGAQAARGETVAPAARSQRMAACRPDPLPPRLTKEEQTAHKDFVAELGEEALWLKYQ